MSRTLILPIGIPGSMKTTWAKKIEKDFGIPHVSSDDVREMLYGNAQIQGDFEKVFDTAYSLANDILDKEDVCIFDATNVTRWVRQKAIRRTHANKVIYVIMDNNIKKCLERNAARERYVPEYVIHNMYKKYRKDFPSSCKNEGVNEIFMYNDPKLYEYLMEWF